MGNSKNAEGELKKKGNSKSAGGELKKCKGDRSQKKASDPLPPPLLAQKRDAVAAQAARAALVGGAQRAAACSTCPSDHPRETCVGSHEGIFAGRGKTDFKGRRRSMRVACGLPVR